MFVFLSRDYVVYVFLVCKNVSDIEVVLFILFVIVHGLDIHMGLGSRGLGLRFNACWCVQGDCEVLR